MLSLSVSRQQCHPGKPQQAQPGRPTACQTCGAPGGSDGQLLEQHFVAKGKVRYLCPLCHGCLHLDYAGRMRTGTIIWLPEISQTDLNLMCLAMFLVARKVGRSTPEGDLKGLHDHVLRTYMTLERRAESVQQLFGAAALKSVTPKESFSEPRHLAGLLSAAFEQTDLTERVLAERVNGLRLLPKPMSFDRYIAAVQAVIPAHEAIEQWLPLVAAQSETAQEAGAPVDPQDEFGQEATAEELM